LSEARTPSRPTSSRLDRDCAVEKATFGELDSELCRIDSPVRKAAEHLCKIDRGDRGTVGDDLGAGLVPKVDEPLRR
jgi:hypothetical protein